MKKIIFLIVSLCSVNLLGQTYIDLTQNDTQVQTAITTAVNQPDSNTAYRAGLDSLADDINTLTTSKAPLASPTFTGVVTSPSFIGVLNASDGNPDSVITVDATGIVDISYTGVQGDWVTPLTLSTLVAATANTGGLFRFRLGGSDGNNYAAGYFGVIAEGTWTSTASSRNAGLDFETIALGQNKRRLLIASTGDALFSTANVDTSFLITVDGNLYTEGLGSGTGVPLVRVANTDQIVEDANVSATEFSYLNGVTSAIQTQLDGKIDTLTYNWGIVDTVIVGDLPGWKVPFNIIVIKVSAYTDANTTSFNIQERAAATPNTAGDSLFVLSMVASTTGLDSTSFTGSGGANFAADTWIVPKITATGDVAIFSISVRYIKQ